MGTRQTLTQVQRQNSSFATWNVKLMGTRDIFDVFLQIWVICEGFHLFLRVYVSGGELNGMSRDRNKESVYMAEELFKCSHLCFGSLGRKFQENTFLAWYFSWRNYFFEIDIIGIFEIVASSGK